MIGVKREWIYPLHKSDGSAYYDVAIMELGNLKKILNMSLHNIVFVRLLPDPLKLFC